MIGIERKRRSVLKAITWRVLASIITMILVWIFSGNITLALSVGILEIIAKIIFYYLHERAWGSVSWGIIKKSQ